MLREYVLVINPGSTSTKVAIFKGEENVIQKNLSHFPEELEKFEKITDQYEYRRNIILQWMKDEGYETAQLKAVVGRGGLLKPMPSGTYVVTDALIEDLKIGVQGEHASNLGGIIAKSIAYLEGIEAYIVDPVAVDEFDDVARISGMPEIKRRSLVHALNIKAVAYRVAKEMNKDVNDLNMVMAHLGGGISIVPLRKGKMVDANNANEMGPFSPERTGSLPVGDLAKLCFSGKYTLAEIKKKISGKGGLVAYLGTNDARDVEKMIADGNEKAKLIYDAMGYQIAKEIGAMATVLEGKVDAVVLTGGIAYSKMLTSYITERVSFIAPVIIQPGEDEMIALNEGVNRVFSGQDKAKIYEQEVK
ncbi:butyrate kinase [Anaerosolibacter carboniphilus]|uniref:Probable butyrate kinase n=1 Tax=Anaerosolibacter carboniphilus TaxID=1417629 RepID=A0A841KMU5_9FIRM|nr:butyrate kinase [Anaerosolibacter carboniphilus]MBB6215124.1 butyrate kinase [Anaerosolibacter carboniphilus]